jgi:Icc protein
LSVLRLTQVTDLHLGPDPEFETRGVATLGSFKAVLQQIDQQGRGADLLLLTGDLASDCQP